MRCVLSAENSGRKRKSVIRGDCSVKTAPIHLVGEGWNMNLPTAPIPQPGLVTTIVHIIKMQIHTLLALFHHHPLATVGDDRYLSSVRHEAAFYDAHEPRSRSFMNAMHYALLSTSVPALPLPILQRRQILHVLNTYILFSLAGLKSRNVRVRGSSFFSYSCRERQNYCLRIHLSKKRENFILFKE